MNPEAPAGIRVLYFLPDGFGGHGGISQFNKDLLTALCSFHYVREVVALPRHLVHEIGALPPKLIYDTSSVASKLRYGLRSLHYILHGGPFDLIICTHLNLLPIAALARNATGAPAILVLHGIEAWQPPRNLATRRCATRADWFAAVSALTLRRFQAWAPTPADRGVVLPCCVDLDRFTPGAPNPEIVERYRLAGTRPVLSLARLAGLERSKGFDKMLQALPSILDRVPDAVYVIAGYGDDRDRLEAVARNLGIADRVRFTGYVSEAEKIDLYRASRAFVLAGHCEGFGIVLLEAMACGVPVVASSSDGSFEAIRGGKLGIAVDPDDRAALTDGVVAALARPAGVRPPELAYFSFTSFSRRVDALVRKAVGESAAARPRGASPGAARF